MASGATAHLFARLRQHLDDSAALLLRIHVYGDTATSKRGFHSRFKWFVRFTGDSDLLQSVILTGPSQDLRRKFGQEDFDFVEVNRPGIAGGSIT